MLVTYGNDARGRAGQPRRHAQCVGLDAGIASHFQEALLAGRGYLHDSLTWQTRGRFTGDEVAALLRSLSPIAHPHSRTEATVAALTFHPAGLNHGWPSYRAATTAPTDGHLALGISWCLTIPHRETVISEIDNLRPTRRRPDPVAPTSPGTRTNHRRNGWRDTAYRRQRPHAQWPRSYPLPGGRSRPRVYTEGGPELLSKAETDFLKQVMQALVAADHDVLEMIGAYKNGGDPYMWTHDYGQLGQVHFVMPPGEVSDWPVEVLQVDDKPGVSLLVIDMWTREEGRSALSLDPPNLLVE